MDADAVKYLYIPTRGFEYIYFTCIVSGLLLTFNTWTTTFEPSLAGINLGRRCFDFLRSRLGTAGNYRFAN